MDKFQIETAQNVSIHQQVANVSDRIGAFLLDGLFMTAYYILVILLARYISDTSIFESIAFWSLITLPVFFYHLFFETFFNGQSPGKSILKIRVVKLDGSKPTFGSYLVRWVLRIVDITFASGSVALLTILLNGKGQRLGDLAAGTTVISEKQMTKLSDTLSVAIPADYKPTFPQVTTLNDADVQTIKDLYYKALREKNHKVINKLHAKIIELTGITTDMKPINFVEVVINDYHYYTQLM